MQVRAQHICEARKTVVFEDDGMFFEFWSHDGKNFNYHWTEDITTVPCGHCNEEYETLPYVHSIHYHGVYEELLRNPIPIIIRHVLK